jgi:hypothetical protein
LENEAHSKELCLALNTPETTLNTPETTLNTPETTLNTPLFVYQKAEIMRL